MTSILKKFVTFTVLLSTSISFSETGNSLQKLTEGWQNPARTYKSHTRWWWPGNALTKQDITWQLEQMAEQGFGGVEIMSAWKMYPKGDNDFLSPEFLDLLKFAVAEGKRLDIEVAITAGPGWSFGGPWIAEEDWSKNLKCEFIDLAGGTHFSGTLPLPKKRPNESVPLVAVVAGRLSGTNQLDEASLTVLTPKVQDAQLQWDVPDNGHWRVMAFWLKNTGQRCSAQNMTPPAMVVDHLNKEAIQRYFDHLGGILYDAVGEEFGKTVDSFFCDSFEIVPEDNALLWSTDTLAGFKDHAGYDLTHYLPAIWFDIGSLTPRIRYDLGSYLNDLGLETVFETMNDWCDAHNVQARVQPHYRFTTELVQGAGATARPETEMTTKRFEPVADPRRATASGARFYGRDFISAEAYTFTHLARYFTSLQDLKISTDAFLCDGVTQFYNHGYLASPEKQIAPTRDVPWANRIDHRNIWWPYYRHFADYVARSCYMLRQGQFMADVLIYSPQATAWSQRAIWNHDRRIMPYGNLAKTLVANGYDFDIINDDLLRNHARIHDGIIEVSGYERRVIILPEATVVPLETMKVLEQFVNSGGKVVVLSKLPEASAGLTDWKKNDSELRQIVDRMLRRGTEFIPEYKIDKEPLNPAWQPPSPPTPPINNAQQKLLDILHGVIAPDVSLDNRAQSDGLTFSHRQVDETDIYFVSNLQRKPLNSDLTFRVKGKTPQRWDAMTGEITPVTFRETETGTVISCDFAQWESAFFVFLPNGKTSHKEPASTLTTSIPIDGPWNMTLEADGFETVQTRITTLKSWTKTPRTRHFSGTGIYETDFELPATAIGKSQILNLGGVGNIAEVEVNGKPVGVSWMPPHKLDLTDAARLGNNHLVVKVTNVLINSVRGLEEPPEVPKELQPRLGKGDRSLYGGADSFLREMQLNINRLPPAGLLGPVVIEIRSAETDS